MSTPLLDHYIPGVGWASETPAIPGLNPRKDLMPAARPLPPGAVRFGDLPRHAQLRVYLRNAVERRDRARRGYVRSARQYHLGERGWAYDPRAAERSLPRYEARVEDLLTELGQSIIERLDAPSYPTQPSAEELEAAHWDALVAERDALAAKLAAVEKVADELDRVASTLEVKGLHSPATIKRYDAHRIRKALA